MNDRRLTILQVLPRLDMGGSERVAIQIAEAIHSCGHTALIAAAPGPLDSLAKRAGAELVPLPLKTKNPLGIWRNAGSLQKLIAARKVDLVHAHSRAPAWSAYFAARRSGVPFVTTYHGGYSETSGLKRRYNEVMAKGDRVVAVSRYIAGLIQQRYGLGDDRLRVVHGGVDMVKFDPVTVQGDRTVRLARAWRADAGQPMVMLPARLTSWKGQKLFIEALAQLRHKDVLGLLVGDDQGRHAYTRELVRLAQSLGLANRVRMVGHAEDMPAALMLADVVVNCSGKPEAFGLTVIEAQAMGRVVVAANHGGAAETVLSGESGFLFEPNNAAALAGAIDAALDMDLSARLELGRVARAHVGQDFSIQAMQARMLDVYAELLG
jgi:glycosyltransferase involved in cell wall biosynthesis